MTMKYYWDDKEESQSTLSKICPLSLWQTTYPHTDCPRIESWAQENG